jgi:hypothetical protein
MNKQYPSQKEMQEAMDEIIYEYFKHLPVAYSHRAFFANEVEVKNGIKDTLLITIDGQTYEIRGMRYKLIPEIHQLALEATFKYGW